MRQRIPRGAVPERCCLPITLNGGLLPPGEALDAASAEHAWFVVRPAP